MVLFQLHFELCFRLLCSLASFLTKCRCLKFELSLSTLSGRFISNHFSWTEVYRCIWSTRLLHPSWCSHEQKNCTRACMNIILLWKKFLNHSFIFFDTFTLFATGLLMVSKSTKIPGRLQQTSMWKISLLWCLLSQTVLSFVQTVSDFSLFRYPSCYVFHK